ncbi:MAG: methyltransferase domain-containing protein [Candidatus Azambacteria bacterium]|nr:methyltransferase domain-containing protein [Candidatus Azambacteria bacterium]
MRTKQILEKYSKEIIANGKILDIGFGDGNNVIWLAEQGFEVTAIDKNREVFDNFKKIILQLDSKLKIKLENKNIKKFEMPPNYYNAVVAFNSLIFLKKSEFLEIIDQIKNRLTYSGIIFLSLFTEEDSSYFSFTKNKKPIENNTFFNEKTDEYWQFMKKGELKKLFSDFKTLFYKEEIIHDKLPIPHNHGIVFYIGKKKARNN